MKGSSSTTTTTTTTAITTTTLGRIITTAVAGKEGGVALPSRRRVFKDYDTTTVYCVIYCLYVKL